MSTDEAGVLADLDARATALIGAPYTASRTAMLNGLFSVVAYAVARWSPSSSGAASAVKTTGADVDVSGSAPPSAGQVLTATNATHATWQTPSTGSSDHATLTHLDYASSGHTGFVPSTRTVSAGTGLTGGGALSADRTLALDVSGVTAASKGSATRAVTLTVDTYGRATALSDVLITPAWSSLTGTPTTLSGYGITDALSTSTAWSGDLGGTGASPTVARARGLRETSGPTTLVVGAIADGQVLRRSGATLIGAWLSVSCIVAGADGGASNESIVRSPTPAITLPAGAPV